MRVSVMVLGDPAVSSAWQVALCMLEAAHKRGFDLDTLFFFFFFPYTALNQNIHLHIYSRWSQLQVRTGLNCLICKTALSRLGAVESVPEPFRLGGLVDWLAACERSDRVLRLGGLRPFGPFKA